MASSDSTRFWVASEVALAAALVVLPASLGGAPEWTAWLLWLLSALAVGTWLLGARRHHRRWSLHPALWLPVVLAGVVVLQLIPLPPGVLRVVSPPQAALRDFALVPLGLDAWRPVAVDVPSTLKALARIVSLGALFFVALELGRFSAVRRRLFAVLALASAATAVCGFVHLLAGADALFGVKHFYGVVPLLTPFGNTNHLSAWLTLGGTVALALALKSPTRDAAIGWAAVAAVSAAGVFFSFSRGGIGLFIATWGLVAVSLVARRSGGMRGSLPWLFITATLLVAGFLTFEQLVERAETLSSLEKLKATKVELWPMFLSGVTRYWPLGMGAGGFELGFSPAQTRELSTTFTHPEMVALQWAADFGLPLAVLCGAFFAWVTWRLWFATRPHVVENVVLLALLGVVAHDVFDFALELNAVAPAFVIIAGLLCALDAGAERERAPRGLALALGAAVAACGPMLLVALPGFVGAEKALQSAITEGRRFEDVRAEAVRAIDRHPADWVLYANVAQDAARRAGPREALAWINRVLVLRPEDGASHVAAARALLRLQQPAQALGEYKLAWEKGDTASLADGLALAVKLDALDRVLLDQPGHLEALYRLLRNQRDDARALQLLETAQQFPPSDAVAEEANLLRVRHEAELGSSEAALAALDALAPEVANAHDLVMTRVQALTRLGRRDEAAKALERLLNREPSNVSAALALSDALGAMNRPAAAREVLQRVRPFVSNTAQRSALFQREAALWLLEGRFPRALDALQTASRLEPSSAGLHYRWAEVYERMGSLHSAADEVRRGRLLDSPEGAKSRDEWLRRLENTGVIQ